jgi:putative membrane protein
MWGDGWHGAWGAIMILVMVVVLALIVVGIVLLVRTSARPISGRDHTGGEYWHRGPDATPTKPDQRRRALDLLEERYARGEVEREDFLQRKKDLLGTGEQ